MLESQQTLAALERAIHALASSGIQSYTLPNGKTVTRTSLRSLREQAETLREQLSLEQGSPDGGRPDGVPRRIRELVVNWLDQLIGFVAPRAALERQQFRDALELQRNLAYGRSGRSYRAAQRKRTDDFTGGGESADASILWGDLDELRNRAREQLRDSAIASAVAAAFVDGVVGTGLHPEPKLDAEALGITQERAQDFERAAERLWRRWV